MTDQGRLTVMGPDGVAVPNKDLLNPSSLTPTTNKFKWRDRVQLSATTVNICARGGDKRAEGILNALGLTLFNALDAVFASKVERVITSGLIALDLNEDEDNASNNATAPS